MDDNKIEITVELDTKNAEKEAKELNKKLVDGAKDATREFDKMKQSVGKNFNNIQKQVEKTFDGAKMANKMSSSVSKALDGIKGKINSILGNINVNANLNANTSSSNQKTNNNGSSLGGAIVGGSAVGAMLSKTQALNKVLKDTRVKIGDVIKDQKTSLQHTKNAVKENMKWNDTMDSISDATTEIVTDVDCIDDVFYDTVVTVDKMSNVMKDFRKNVDIKDILSSDTIELERMEVIANQLLSLFSNMNGLNSSINGVGRFADELEYIDDLIHAINAQKLGIGLAINQGTLTKDLQVIVGVADKATSRFNIFKTQAVEALVSVERKCPMIGKAISTIGTGVNKAVAKGKELGQAFKQGFNEPQQYIDRMKNKIQEWANKHKQATEKVKSANKSVGGSFKSLLSQVLPFASIYGIFNGLKTSITSFASGLQQSGKFATVFGSETQKMSEWLDEINSKVTTSKSTLMDFSSTLYRMGKNMGASTDDALSMAQSMTELGADLEAFTGDANSIEALAGALRGEYDSLQNYGYALSASAVEARALAMGLDSASESALMMARQSLILEQSGDVLGYASGQAQTLSGQMAMLRKNFQALGTAIGSCFAGLLQIVLPVLNRIVQAVTQAFSKLAGLINSIFGLFGVKVGASGSTGGGGIGSAIGGITDSLGSGLDDAGSGAGKVADDLASGAESAKEIAKGLMGIDEINTISLPKGDKGSGGSGSGGSGSGGSGSGGLGDLGGLGSSLGETTSVLEEVNSELTKFQKGFLAIWEQLVDGFNRHKDAIISLWNELKDNLNALGQEMADFFVSAWQNGLDRTVNLIGGISGAIVETALNIANSVVEVVKGLFDHLNPDNNENTKKFIDAINYLLEQIEGFITDAGKWFSQFATACQPFINNLGDIAMIVGGILAEVLADAIQLVRDFMNSWVGQAIIEGIAGALEWLSGVLESCLGFIQEHITFFEALTLGILGAWGAFKLINTVITIWNGLAFIFANVGAICSTVVTILGGAIALLTNPITWVVLAIGALIAIGVALYKNWDEVKAWCTKAWDAICKGIQDAGKIIATTFDYMKTTALNKCKEIWNNIKSIWESIKGYFSQVLNAIKNTVSGVINNIKTIFSNGFNTAKATAINIFNNIKNSISNILNGAKTAISNVIGGIRNLFSNGFDACKQTVSNVFNNIKTSIQNIMNGARDIVKGAIDKIKGFFNFTWSLPKIKLPHFSMTGKFSLDPPSIPKIGVEWYKNGGILTKPTIFGMNGNNLMAGGELSTGGEAILPLNKLFNELGRQFDKQNQALSKGNNQPVNITLKLDGREISKATFKNFEELSRLGIIDLSTLI